MPRTTKSQRAILEAQRLEKEALELAEYKQNVPAKILFELLPELFERNIHYQVNNDGFARNTFSGFECVKSDILLNIGDNWYNLTSPNLWDYQDMCQNIVDYDEKVNEELRISAEICAAKAKLSEREKKLLNIR